MAAGSFLWGASSSGYSYQNTLTVGYPFYDVLTDREARAGSEYVQSPSGVEDSWITGRDYTMQVAVRWIDDSPTALPTRAPVSGPGGWQDFLDYARAKNPFRWCPDASLPSAYVDGCYLMEPMTGFGANLENLQRGVTVKFRNPSVDFIRALRGVLFEYYPGRSLTDPLTATFTRADATTCATYVDANGLVRTVPANVLRDRHYVGGVRTTLLEGARTNLCLRSQDFSVAGVWVPIGTPQLGTPLALGDLSLDFVGDDDAAAFEGYYQTIGLTGNAVKGLSFFAKEGTAPNAAGFSVIFEDFTAGADRLRATITWASGVPTVTMVTGSIVATTAVGNGVYRFLFTTTAATAAHTHRLDVYAVAGAAAAVGNVYIGGVQVEDAAFPSSYIKTTAAAVTRAADALSFPFAAVPQAMTLHAWFVEGGSAAAISQGIFGIGEGIDAGLYITTPPYQLAHERAGSVISVAGAVPAVGDTVELRSILYADGSVQLGQAINGAAEVVAAQSAANTLATAWHTLTMWLGDIDGTHPSFTALRSLKVAPGVRTLAQMRAL